MKNSRNFWYAQIYNETYRNEYDGIYNILQYIKDTMYDRKIIPLYVKEMVDENNDLKNKYESYQKDSEEFYKFKSKYENEIKPYLDLEKERERLSNIKIKLAEEKRQINFVKLKLDEEKKKIEFDRDQLEDEKNKYGMLDINSFLQTEENICCKCLEETNEKFTCGHYMHQKCCIDRKCPICII
jgi:hypothetical protein